MVQAFVSEDTLIIPYEVKTSQCLLDISNQLSFIFISSLHSVIILYKIKKHALLFKITPLLALPQQDFGDAHSAPETVRTASMCLCSGTQKWSPKVLLVTWAEHR